MANKNSFDVKALMSEVASSFVSEVASYSILGEGTHRVIPTKLRITHSFLKADNTPKDGPFDWKTPTPVVAITFANDEGAVVMERFHLRGFKKYEDLTSEQKEDNSYSSSKEGYALKDGDRIIDKKKTQQCVSILSGVFSALGIPVGSNLDALQAVIDARETEVDIVVKKASGGDFMEVTKVMAVKVTEEIQEFN